MVSHGDMSPRQRSRDVEVVLPNEAKKKIKVYTLCTVSELKVICEKSFGIPTELQNISLLDDAVYSELKDCVMVPKAPLKLRVPIWWNKFICCVLKNEVENVFRRVQLPMQQVGKDERIFVALFMGACCGLDDLVARLAKLKTNVNLSTATDTGRTLLHACAASGSLNCLDIIIKHLLTSSLYSLENVDVNKENAYQLAVRLHHQDVAERLLYYMNIKITHDETCKALEQGVEAVSEATMSSSSPHQRQANRDRKINNEAISNERVVEKNKQNKKSDAKEDINSDDNEIHQRTSTKYEETLDPNEGSGYVILSEQQEEAKTISDMPVNGLITPPTLDTSQLDTDRLSNSPIKPTRGSQAGHLLSKRRGNEQNIHNASTTVPGISTSNESSEDDELEQKTRLPSLGPQTYLSGQPLDGSEKVFQVQHRPGRKLVICSISAPNSPDMSPVVSPRISPTSEVSSVLAEMITDTRSAPNSPLARRSIKKTLRAVGMTARFAVGAYANPPSSPISRPKVSREPIVLATPNVGNAGIKFDRYRRGSLAVGNGAFKVPVQRGKSRSVCEVTFNESLHNHLLTKTMETEERMELPWNAWIAAKKKESVSQQPTMTLAPMPENKQLQVPVSPNARRRSFQQWLNEKDMEQLRQMHEQSQIEERNDAERTGRQVKGKSFEEWLEEKHRESQREKEKLKEKEEAEKSEVEKKMRRRRMSQQKYQSWLQEKELKALEEEEKLLGEAKKKLEKMKVKWEEEDEMKKTSPVAMGKVAVGRTNSCPTSNTEDGKKISRQRFSSLHVTSK